MASPELPFCTCRFQYLPSHLNDENLRSIIRLGPGERVMYSSLSADEYASNQSLKTGTITWNVVPQVIKELSLGDFDTLQLRSNIPISGDGNDIIATLGNATIDSHLMGLTPLHSSSTENNDSVTIVAITGVGGRPFVSWQHQSGAMWLRDYVARDIPGIKVFVYGYPSKLLQSVSHSRLADYTKQFLAEIQRLASAPLFKSGPLVLIGHSFGGLMIKSAIVEAASKREKYEKVLTSIYSVFFLGVPHRGLNVRALKEMVTKEPTKDLIAELEEGSTSMISISKKFSESIQGLKIVSCWELKETPTQQRIDGKWKRTGTPEIMVNESSACLYISGEEFVPIQANHSMMAKLSDEARSEYHTLKNLLVSHVHLAPETISRRLIKQECAYVFSEVYPLAAFVYEIVGIVKAQKIEVAKYQDMLENEMSFLEAFGRILVDDEMSWIFDNPDLSAGWPDYMASCLQKLRSTLSSYTHLAMRYYEPYRKAFLPKGPAASSISVPDYQRSSLMGNQETQLLEDLHLNGNILNEMTFDRLLEQCRQSTRGLREAIAFAASCSLRFDTRLKFERFRDRKDIHQMKLAPTIRRQYLIQTQGVQKVKPLVGRLQRKQDEPVDPNILLMDYYANSGTDAKAVIVEYRYYDKNPHLELDGRSILPEEDIRRQRVEKVKSRMQNLAGVLQDAFSGSVDNPVDDMSYLGCLGFLEEPKLSRFAFLFRPPSATPVPLNQLRTLSEFIKDSRTSGQGQQGVPLEMRFALAKKLCDAVIYLHACGWVHKSIRSSNILLAPGATRQQPPLYLKGFEVSRPAQAASSARASFDPHTNLYRHPARQGDPTDRFRKQHDLYALGVVLLEIGLWETIPSLFRRVIDRTNDTGGAFPAPERIKAKLVELANGNLPTGMGTKYAKAVQTCLDGEFDVTDDDEQQTRLGFEFRKRVVEIMEAGSKL